MVPPRLNRAVLREKCCKVLSDNVSVRYIKELSRKTRGECENQMRFNVRSSLTKSEALKLAGLLYKYQYAMTKSNSVIRGWGDLELLTKLHEEYLPDWPPEKIISHTQKYFEVSSLPFLNKIAVKVKTDGQGMLSFVDPQSGITVSSSTGGMDLAISDCWAKFDRSFGQFLEAVIDFNFDAFLDCLTSGIASIESFLNTEAYLKNEQRKQLNAKDAVRKSEIRETSIAEKILTWPEKLTGKPGRITEGSRDFVCWKRLKDLRNSMAIHQKGPRVTPSPEEFTDYVNGYRFGIADLLVELHKDFDDSIHPLLIWASFFPAVELAYD